MKKRFIKIMLLAALGSIVLVGCGTQQTAAPSAPAQTATAGTDDLKKQVDDIKGVLPKFAIPMREVGDRFDNMYYAAKGGNWALAAYMSKYMDSAMKPAKLTKPNEYPAWASFNSGAFDPINKAIAAKDFNAFDKAYTSVIESCNGCHTSMGYKFIKVSKQPAPTEAHFDYNLKSEPGDVPK